MQMATSSWEPELSPGGGIAVLQTTQSLVPLMLWVLGLAVGCFFPWERDWPKVYIGSYHIAPDMKSPGLIELYDV